MKGKYQLHPALFFVLLAMSLEAVFAAISITVAFLVASAPIDVFVLIVLVLSIKAPLVGLLTSAFIDTSLAQKVIGRLVGLTNGVIIGGLIGTRLNSITSIVSLLVCALLSAYFGQWLIVRIRAASEQVIIIREGKARSE